MNNEKNDFKAKAGGMFSSRTYKNGVYSVGLTAVVIVLAIVVMLFVNMLPDSLKQIDTSNQKLYSIGDETRRLLDAVTDDITIVVVAEESTLDKRISKLADQYDENCDKITTIHLDPVANPVGLTTYDTSADSIVVKNEVTGKMMSVSFSDIIKYDYVTYSQTGVLNEKEFDGEGQITGALYYVINTDTQQVYYLTGHNEEIVVSSLRTRLKKIGIEASKLDLMTAGSVPDDCKLLIINGPTIDFADDELASIREYCNNGGKLIYLSGLPGAEITNVEALLSDFGVTVYDGTLIDSDAGSHYRYNNTDYFNYILPTIQSLPEIGRVNDKPVLMFNSVAYGIDQSDMSLSTEYFMQTSALSQLVTADYNQNTTPSMSYTVGADIVRKNDNGTESSIVLFGSYSLIDNDNILSAFGNLGNADMFVNAVSWSVGDVDAGFSIPSKSLAVVYNNVNSKAAASSIVFIVAIPVAIFAAGMTVWIKRRRR